MVLFYGMVNLYFTKKNRNSRSPRNDIFDSIIWHYFRRGDFVYHRPIMVQIIDLDITVYFTNYKSWDHHFIIHYSDVIMGTMTSQITSLTIVYSAVYSGTDHRKHQSSASLAFVRGIHHWLVNSLHKRPVTRKMFPFDDIIMCNKNILPLHPQQQNYKHLQNGIRYIKCNLCTCLCVAVVFL